MLFGDRQLPQGDVEASGLRLRREPFGMELDVHLGSRERVPQLVGESGRELGEQPGSLGLPDGLLHLLQLIGHALIERASS